MADELRIGDAERDDVATTLRTAFAEGRLDEVELEERLEQTYKAKTASQLVPLTTDLPGHRSHAEISRTSATTTRGTMNVWDPTILAILAPMIGVCVLVTIIWAITTPGDYFWPVWVYLGMSVPAAGSIWTLWIARQRKSGGESGAD